MKYSEFRANIKTGDLLAFSNTTWSSWHDFQVHVVRMATESEFSHVGIAYVVNDRVFVLEAVSQGVVQTPISEYKTFFHASNPELLSQVALDFAFAKMGTPYESKILMVLNQIINLRLNRNSRLQCSEYVNGILCANKQWLTSTDTPTAIVMKAMMSWGSLTRVDAD